MHLEKKPLWVWIDPTRACNLKCRYCYAKSSHLDGGHLSVSGLERVLQTLQGCPGITLQKLHLNWRGEPTMNPDFVELLRRMEGAGLKCPWEFHTNGLLLDDRLAREIVDVVRTGLIYVSIDGGTEASHETNRGCGTFRPSLAGLRTLLEARGSRKSPRIGIYQIDLGEAEEAYDADFLALVEQVDTWTRTAPVNPRNGQELSKTLAAVSGVPVSRRPSETPNDSAVDQRGFLPTKACFWAGNSLFIAPDGDVSVCLLSHSADGVVGNIFKQPLEEIIEAASGFRRNLDRLSRAAVPHCKSCLKCEGRARPEIKQEATGQTW